MIGQQPSSGKRGRAVDLSGTLGVIVRGTAAQRCAGVIGDFRP